MNSNREKAISKRLSYVLRHDPGSLGLSLAPGGWVDVQALLAGLAKDGFAVSREDLDYVVANNQKRRFALDEAGGRVRAVQGHSVDVDMEYEPSVPPAVLYHGTVAKVLDAIRAEGLTPQTRQHVHLSVDLETANIVGARRGRPVILMIDAAAMTAEGRSFYQAPNDVWLTDVVPPRFITFPD